MKFAHLFAGTIVLVFLLTACGPSQERVATMTASAWTPTIQPTEIPSPTSTITPFPPTPTFPPSGIDGTVAYAGTSSGGILILLMDKMPVQNESPMPLEINTFTTISGEFNWNMPPGTYYIIAFLTINRQPEGPALPNEPLVFCDPIQVATNPRVTVKVALNNDDIGGKGKNCLK